LLVLGFLPCAALSIVGLAAAIVIDARTPPGQAKMALVGLLEIATSLGAIGAGIGATRTSGSTVRRGGVPSGARA
jgi:hypothetical protein